MRFGDFEVDIPKGWDDQTPYTFVAPDGFGADPGRPGGFRANVVFQHRRLEPGETLDSCLERTIASTRESFGEVAIRIEPAPDALRHEGRRVQYAVNEEVSRQRVRQIIYVFLAAGREWSFAFSLADAGAEGALPELERLVCSFRPGLAP